MCQLPVLVFSVIALIACQSAEAPETVSIASPLESEALNLDLEGTAWILEPEETLEFPGYRGFYLGRDGRLLLINFPDAIGDRWENQEDSLSLSFLDGFPELMNTPLAQNFHITVDSTENGLPEHIRLVPENSSNTVEIPLTRGSAEVSLVENYWILKVLAGSEDVHWPSSADVYMILLPGEDSLGILGHGGVNRFRGDVEIGEESFRVGLLASTLMSGPYLDFENRYTLGLMSVNRYVQVGFNLFLYSDTTATAAFRTFIFN